jgi:hypothetical protein
VLCIYGCRWLQIAFFNIYSNDRIVFFSFTFQSINTSSFCAFAYGNTHTETTMGGSKLTPSYIFFRLHNPVRLSSSLPSSALPPSRLSCPLYKGCLPDLCCLLCLPTVDEKICVWPSILLQLLSVVVARPQQSLPPAACNTWKFHHNKILLATWFSFIF